MSSDHGALPVITKYQRPALVVGLIALLILIVAALISTGYRAQVLHSYLVAYLFWIGIAVGTLALLMLQHMTGGEWGLVIRRILEAASHTLQLMAVLFIPIIVGANYLYPWRHHEEMAKTPALQQKERLYLNLPLFTGRAVLYFTIWIMFAYLLRKWSLEQDRTADRRFTKRMRMLSGPGLAILVITITFASVDWAMSLNPEWFSTIYGLIFVGAWTVSALAFVIAAAALLSGYEPLARAMRPSHFQDLGKLMLALIMLWAYFAFSQFLIVWSGNLPEEIQWYLPRVRGGWGAIALAVVLFHFAFPFLLLLSASLKRDPRKLLMLAGLILFMRLIDMFWMITPEFSKSFHVSWLDIVAPIAIGGIWLAMFLRQLGKHPLIPINDPQYDGLMAQSHAHAGH